MPSVASRPPILSALSPRRTRSSSTACVDVAAGLGERVLAVHHPRARAVAELLDLLGGDRRGAHFFCALPWSVGAPAARRVVGLRCGFARLRAASWACSAARGLGGSARRLGGRLRPARSRAAASAGAAPAGRLAPGRRPRGRRLRAVRLLGAHASSAASRPAPRPRCGAPRPPRPRRRRWDRLGGRAAGPGAPGGPAARAGRRSSADAGDGRRRPCGVPPLRHGRRRSGSDAARAGPGRRCRRRAWPARRRPGRPRRPRRRDAPSACGGRGPGRPRRPPCSAASRGTALAACVSASCAAALLGLAARLLLGLAAGALLGLAARLLLGLAAGALLLLAEAARGPRAITSPIACVMIVAGADRVVVARDHVVDAVRVAVRVDQADDRDPQALGLAHGDRLGLEVDHEQRVGHALHVLDAAEVRPQLLEVGLRPPSARASAAAPAGPRSRSARGRAGA